MTGTGDRWWKTLRKQEAFRLVSDTISSWQPVRSLLLYFLLFKYMRFCAIYIYQPICLAVLTVASLNEHVVQAARCCRCLTAARAFIITALRDTRYFHPLTAEKENENEMKWFEQHHTFGGGAGLEQGQQTPRPVFHPWTTLSANFAKGRKQCIRY